MKAVHLKQVDEGVLPALLESAEPGVASREDDVLVEVRTTSPTFPSTPGIDPGGTAHADLRSPAHNDDPIPNPVEKLRLTIRLEEVAYATYEPPNQLISHLRPTRQEIANRLLH
ncbi:hypothetical protein AOLI_G00078750 [Acnodon oligacanthus]